MNNKNIAEENIKLLKNVAKKANVFANSLCDPILGKHFKLPARLAGESKVQLDTSLSYIPVYTHLKISDAEMLKRPETPPAIRRIENEDYMEFYATPNAAAATVGTKQQNLKPTALKKDENTAANSKYNTRL